MDIPFTIFIAARSNSAAPHYSYRRRTSPARLAGIKALGLGGAHDLDALLEAQGVFLDLLLDQQIEDMDHGAPVSNTVVIKRLSHRDRDRLRSALNSVGQLDQLTQDLIF